ncbi:MAG: RNA polymerase factor sigma-54 [Candidatus Omnitrophica bacterium]|nr:RNA polymerase factor sigma-54 [Candidatus Omnitrophota bacterium]
METRLTQQQSQKLVLSPQMRQYLRLLQLPVANLEQAIDEEMSQNPLLEEKSTPQEELPQDGESQSKPEKTEEVSLGDSYDRIDEIDNYYDPSENRFEDRLADPSDLQKKKTFQDSLLTRPQALSDFLLWQIRFLDFSEDQKKIAEEIIGNINEDGYLSISCEELSESLHKTKENVEGILKSIQTLEPPGIAARNLQEALLLQLKKLISPSPLAENMVKEHLSLLEKQAYDQLSKIYAVDLETVKEAVHQISRLDPKPGRSFYSEEPIAIKPDASVFESDEDDAKWEIEIHEESLPRLRVNPYYRHLLRKKGTDEKTRAFIQIKLQKAQEFLQALLLRKSTLREITQEIVKHQDEFLRKGFGYLKPLRLKDISGALSIHESTVSRAVQNKYISTPQGTIPYKSFFSNRLDTLEGEEEVSQKSITHRIRHMIDSENPASPLSDQEIAEKLLQEGVKIARRTVAKYRDILKILPSHLRKHK